MKSNKLYQFVGIFTALVFILSACGPAATKTSAEPTKIAKSSSTPSILTAPEPIVLNGTTYSLNGAYGTAEVNKEKGYVVYKTEGKTYWMQAYASPNVVVEGNQVLISVYAAQIDPKDNSVMDPPMTCAAKLGDITYRPINGSSEITATGDESFDYTCAIGPDQVKTISADFKITVLSALTLATPVPPVDITPWNQLTEQNNYLICDQTKAFNYQPIGGITEVAADSNCGKVKLLDRNQRRVIYKGNVVTIDDKNVLGGYAAIDASALVPGRTYFYCDLTKLTGENNLDQSNFENHDGCVQGIFISMSPSAHGNIAEITTYNGVNISIQPVNEVYPSLIP